MNEELVVDASAVADALIRGDEIGNALAQRISGSLCHSPHLIDAEVGSVLRRAERRGLINERTALTSLRLLKFLIDERYSHDGWLALEAWKLRDTVTFYDSLYVALAARLDIPLLTRDIKLSKAPGLPCRIEVCG